MRALLLCPKSATEAANQGLAADEIMNAFITEIVIDSGPAACASALSTDGHQVVSTEAIDLRCHVRHHDLIFTEEGQAGPLKHFTYAMDEEMRGFYTEGRCLIVGSADDTGTSTAATMTVEEASHLFRYAALEDQYATRSVPYLAYDEFYNISGEAYELLETLPTHPDPSIDDAINVALDAVGRLHQLTFSGWM
jgi:hypothetical protein